MASIVYGSYITYDKTGLDRFRPVQDHVWSWTGRNWSRTATGPLKTRTAVLVRSCEVVLGPGVVLVPVLKDFLERPDRTGPSSTKCRPSRVCGCRLI